MKLDLILTNGIVLTMSGHGIGMISDGAIGIKDSSIICVDDSVQLLKQYNAEQIIDVKRKVIMPGFINTHTHSYYGVISRGILTDLVLFLEQGAAGYIETLEFEDKVASTSAHLLEGIKRGVTTFCDQGEGYDKLAFIHEKFGIRARLSEMVREMSWDYRDELGSVYKFDRKYAEDGINATRYLLEHYGTSKESLISAMVCFQALDYVSEELLLELKDYAEANNAMIHTHMSQSPFEIEQVVMRYGARPVEVFDRFGLLNENTLAAHLLYNTVEENKRAAESGMKMAYCPYSFCQVGSSPPAAQYVNFGGVVGIGSDEASYTCVNPIADMKSAHLNANVDAYLHNLQSISLLKVLRMHTIEAADAIGMKDQIGSLEPGKKADIIVLNPYVINMAPTLVSPLTNIPQTIVSAATGNEVEMVIVNGQMIMDNKKLLLVDEAKIMQQIQERGQKAAERANQYYLKLDDSEVLNMQKIIHY